MSDTRFPSTQVLEAVSGNHLKVLRIFKLSFQGLPDIDG